VFIIGWAAIFFGSVGTIFYGWDKVEGCFEDEDSDCTG